MPDSTEDNTPIDSMEQQPWAPPALIARCLTLAEARTVLEATAAAAGELRATEVWTANGWRKAPAQCPICMDLIRGRSVAEILAIMNAWTTAYRARCAKYEAAALSGV